MDSAGFERVSPDDFITLFKSVDNKDYLLDQIVSRMDAKTINRTDLLTSVNKVINAWITLGKFDKVKNLKYINKITLLDYYNNMFIDVFKQKYDSILIPDNLTQQPMDLNGKYVQQTQIRDYTPFVRKTPFYERALYKRHHASDIEDTMEEAQSLVYVLDTDNMRNGEHRFAHSVNKTSVTNYDYLEREMPVWKLK